MPGQTQTYRVVCVKSDEYADRYTSGKPGSIVRAGDCEFHLFKYYDEYSGTEILDLPRFEENPEYTREGRPFVTAVQEWCPYGESDDPDYPAPGICGDCCWCYLEQPTGAIGVCMCEKLKINSEEALS